MIRFLSYPIGPVLLLLSVPYLNFSGIHSINDAHRAALIIAAILLLILGFLSKVVKRAYIVGMITVILSSYTMKLYHGVLYPSLIISGFFLFWLIDKKISFQKTILLSNVVGIILSVLFLYPAFNYSYGSKKIIPTKSERLETANLRFTPSIIHIVLDGYGSSDILKNIYKHDNQHFTSELEKLGFLVFDQVSVPYNQTLFTMSSVMSGGYIIHPQQNDDPRRFRNDLGHTITNGPLHKILRKANYNYFYTKSGYSYVDFENASKIEADRLGLSSLESELLGFAPSLAAKAHNKILKHALQPKNLQQLAPPFFYYQHLLAPHPPFTITQDGSLRQEPSILLNDGSHFIQASNKRRKEYILGYTEKAKYLESKLLTQLKHAPNDKPIIIIIHGDHGPGAYFNQESIENSCIPERMTSFFAVYSNIEEIHSIFKEANDNSFNIVNTYRNIISVISDRVQHSLTNKSYFLKWSNPSDITKIHDISLPNNCS